MSSPRRGGNPLVFDYSFRGHGVAVTRLPVKLIAQPFLRRFPQLSPSLQAREVLVKSGFISSSYVGTLLSRVDISFVFCQKSSSCLAVVDAFASNGITQHLGDCRRSKAGLSFPPTHKSHVIKWPR
jgi:hypothetical protein